MYTPTGFPINAEFRKVVNRVLNAGTPQLNFTDGQKASEEINSWIRKRTMGKIDQLFTPGLSLTTANLVTSYGQGASALQN